MTIAEIRGKISETGSNLSERMEDLLTSDIFGCFRYLPAEEGLIPFLKTAKSHRGISLDIPSSINSMQYAFWPYLKVKGCNPCEPDLLIGIETDQGLHLIMIEAKYYSGLSSEEDDQDEPNNQLARELDNLATISASQLPWLADLSIISRNLVFVTQDMKIPNDLLSHSLAEYQTKRGNGDIFWTSWRFLPAILENQLAKEFNVEQRAILEDILLLLQKKGLTMFRGIKPITHNLAVSDFEFYHITPQKFLWPDISVLEPIKYSYSLPKNKYEWPSMPAIKMNYEYSRR